jgi:hypothetical protein
MPFKIAARHSARKQYHKEVSRTATRPFPGRSAWKLQAEVESFLKASEQPALLELGEEIFAISVANFILDALEGRFSLQASSEKRNLMRHVLGVREQARGRMELVVERLPGKRGEIFLLDLAGLPAPIGRGAALVRFSANAFASFLGREFPAWNDVSARTGPESRKITVALFSYDSRCQTAQLRP